LVEVQWRHIIWTGILSSGFLIVAEATTVLCRRAHTQIELSELEFIKFNTKQGKT